MEVNKQVRSKKKLIVKEVEFKNKVGSKQKLVVKKKLKVNKKKVGIIKKVTSKKNW